MVWIQRLEEKSFASAGDQTPVVQSPEVLLYGIQHLLPPASVTFLKYTEFVKTKVLWDIGVWGNKADDDTH
jgi:hypothetical protein